MQTLDQKEKIVNKIKRFSLVIALRKVMPFVSVIGVFLLTIMLGVWNVKRVEYSSSDLLYTDTAVLEETLDEFKGKNIFLLDVYYIENRIKERNTFVKDVTVKKVIPMTLKISLEEYEPEYSFFFDGKCDLYSKSGHKIYQVCEDCENECSSLSSNWKTIYIESENPLVSDGVFLYAEEIGNTINILEEFGYVIVRVNLDNGLALLYTVEESFVFDLSDELDTQLARMYLVGKKINSDGIEFKSLDLRFERPVLKNE